MSDWRLPHKNKKKEEKKSNKKTTKKVVSSAIHKKVEKPKITERKPKAVEKTNSKGNKRGTSPESQSNLKKDAGPGRPKGKLNFDTRVDMAMSVLAMKYVEDFNKGIDKKGKKIKNFKPITLDDVDIEGDIFAQFINKARNGNDRMIDSFLDRRHGKATQPIEMSGKDGNPIEYRIQLEEAKKRLKDNQSKWFKK